MTTSNVDHCHLTYSDRLYIESEIRNKSTFRSIGKFLKKDPTTISKEVKRASIFTSRGAHLTSKDCIYVDRCLKHNVCKPRTPCPYNCRVCRAYRCVEKCDEFVPLLCDKLSKPPYVCNPCPELHHCTKVKHLYRARQAQEAYEKKLKASREGINSSPEEIAIINGIVSPLVKRGQPINHIYAVHADELNCSQKTLYNYIDLGLLDIRNVDLPRRVRYKKRKTHKNEVSKIDAQKFRINRTYKEFLSYVEEHPDDEIVEIDTVKGLVSDQKCLLTMLFRKSSFMFIFLLPTCTQQCVIACFDYIYETLGHDLFIQTFPIILSDNGPEFKNVWRIETSSTGVKRTKVFFCDPNSPGQKGRLEKNHEFIRYVLPKRRSMGHLTQEQVNELASHINSLVRPSLNNHSPFELTEIFWDTKIPALFGLHNVSPDNVHLKPDLIK